MHLFQALQLLQVRILLASCRCLCWCCSRPVRAN